MHRHLFVMLLFVIFLFVSAGEQLLICCESCNVHIHLFVCVKKVNSYVKL